MALYEFLKKKTEDFRLRHEILNLWNVAERVDEYARKLESLPDEKLKELSQKLREQSQKKDKSLDELLVPAFALVREAAYRVLGQRPFDVQVMAGIGLHQGKIVEMKAGEGKTLTETMPVYLNALSGQGVHIVTTNDYLARRDGEWMKPIYDFLGISAGIVTQELKARERRASYSQDITYVTNQEAGFDYLRDNLVRDPRDRVLRRLNFAIVDEVDSILIDEARTPLIIADLVKEPEREFRFFAELIAKLEESLHFETDYETKTVELTEEGEKYLEDFLGFPLFDERYAELVFFVDTALKARTLFEKDRDYMVRDNEIVIVDEFTGRPMPGRRFMEGIHQAIEAKEGVKIREKDRVVASVTFQNFFKLYRKLSGMTGTGWSAAEEFRKVYNLDTVVIPTNRPIRRTDMDDVFYKTKRDKYAGIVRDARLRHRRGQPVLIGTRSIEISEELSRYLRGSEVPHQVLNAKTLQEEAEEIARAGQPGIVTVATNMAGRGTDILLGPNVGNLGGLHVIGTERHQARRIDDQLIGRAGRQGDPGSSQFHISAEDELMALFTPQAVLDALEEIKLQPGEWLSSPRLTAALRQAQRIVEAREFDTRFYLLQYDAVLDKQRAVVYKLRDRILLSGNSSLKHTALPLLDELWKEHLATMEALQDEGSLLSYGQKDPFVEYALEAHEIFEKMTSFFREQMEKRGLEAL